MGLSQPLADELRRVVGPDGFVDEPAALLAYESDALTAYRFTPRAVVLPRSAAEVVAVVRRLAAADVPFTARGAGTGLSGGAIALEQSVIVSTARLDRILEIDPENRRARVEPGVVNAQLNRAVADHGLRYAPDPSSQLACTLGGNVAENAGGPHCLRYGTTVNHITGLTVVLPDGEVVELGGRGEPEGLDLVGLFVGSEGTFGIATEIEVRLIPLPESVETLLATFTRVEDAARCSGALLAEGILPAALELIDHACIEALDASPFPTGYPPDARAALVIELEGDRAGVAADAARARAICVRESAYEVRRAADDTERALLWKGRKMIYAALGRLAPDVLVQDATVPRSAMVGVMRQIYEIVARWRLRVATAAHAGDGNLHPALLFDRRDADERHRVEQASKEMMRACVAAGGTISGEHGVGLDKREMMPLVFGDAELEAMHAVRRVFDPRGRANPAKLLPLRVCREWVRQGPRT